MHHSSKIDRLSQFRFRLRKGGFTLVITLILLAAVVMLVVGMFSSTTLESRITRNYDHSVQAQLAVESGLARAGQLLKRATWSESGVIFPAMEPSPADPNVRVPQRLIGAVPELVGNQVNWTYFPLISGDVDASPDTASGTAQDLRRVNIDPGAAPVATDLPKTYFWQPKPTTYWETVKEPTPEEASAGELSARFCFWIEDMQGNIDLGTAGNFGPAANPMDPVYGGLANARQRKHDRERFVVRANLADYNAAPNAALGLTPRDWYRGLAPGLRTPDDDVNSRDRFWALNQTSLYTLFTPNFAADTATYDNELAIARQFPSQSGPAGAASNLLYAPDVWKAHLANLQTSPMPETALTRFTEKTAPMPTEVGRLTDPAARAIEENTIIGTQPYTEMPVIPPYPAPAFAGVLEPKMNLNRVLMQIQQGQITAGGAVTNTWNSQIGVDVIAKHIQDHLPNFTRRVINPSNPNLGFPLGQSAAQRPMNYLRNLAAGMIDYADRDCLPTYDQAAPASPYSNMGQFYRGGDSYPLVSEQFFRVKWERRYQDNRRRVGLSFTFYYELWNMSNRAVTAEFQAAFLTTAFVKAGQGDRVGLAPLAPSSQSPTSFFPGYTVLNRPTPDRGYWWMPLFEARTSGPESGPDGATLRVPANAPNGSIDRTKNIVTLAPNSYVVLATAPVMIDGFDAGSTQQVGSTNEVAISGPNGATDADLGSQYCIRMRVSNPEQLPPRLFGSVSTQNPPSSPWMFMDRPKGTVERYGRTLQSPDVAGPARQRIITSLPGMSYAIQNGGFANNVGDPRASFYINYIQDQVNYAEGASPWGQNFRKNIASGNNRAAMFSRNRINRWPDLGHNCGPGPDGPDSTFGENVAWGRNINLASGSNVDDISPHDPTILARRNTLLAAEPDNNPPESGGDKLTWDRRAPVRISNAGRFFSVTELGNIFDPIMWNPRTTHTDNGAQGTPSAPLTWADHADISVGSLAAPSDRFCGGNTLRIGRFDHSRFRPSWDSVQGTVDNEIVRIGTHDNDRRVIGPFRGGQPDRGLVATALLDLFHCGIPIVDHAATTTAAGNIQAQENLRDLTGPLTEVRGHININTASRDALRAVIAGEFTTDPVYPETQGSGATSSPRPPSLRIDNKDQEAGLIADRIIQSRTNLPFLSTAELSERIVADSKKADGTINTDMIKAVLGDPRTDYKQPDVLPAGTGTTTEWNDTMMEEVFARIYNSTTVRSRNFRVFVTGQVRKPRRSDPTQSDILATRSRVFHVFIKPIRDPNTGVLVDQKIEITHARDL